MDRIVEWAIVLFFLLYGLAGFVPQLNSDVFRKVIALLALIAGIGSIIAGVD